MTKLDDLHALNLRKDAEALASNYPALLADAQHLAAAVSLGAHGRRRAGLGEDFWQYRPALPGDDLRSIDWRRSGHSDATFVKQHEWESTQSVHFWSDTGGSMAYRSDKMLESKAGRARLLCLASAILLSQAGERVGLMQNPEPPRQGQSQISRMAISLALDSDQADYGTPPDKHLALGSRVVFASDFLGDWPHIVQALSRAADQKVTGCLLQILDPAEESFPFHGRTLFESMKGQLRFETMRARSLRDDYLSRLQERKDQLVELARQTGWLYNCHHTDKSAQSALLWVYTALDGRP